MMKHKKEIRALISDFDGVLCSDYFYHTMEHSHPEIYEKINKEIFRNSRPIIRAWMRGGITYRDVHKIMSANYQISTDFLEKELINSVKKMVLNKYLLSFIEKIRKQGVKTALLTDNMDVFDKFFVSHTNIDQYFDLIISSARKRQLKADNEGELVDWTISKLKVKPEQVVMIDDGEKIGKIVQKKNIPFFLYSRNYGDSNKKFTQWFSRNFTPPKASNSERY